jgi:hypothetical protein
MPTNTMSLVAPSELSLGSGPHQATRTVDSYLLVVSGVSTHLGGEAKENPKRLCGC